MRHCKAAHRLHVTYAHHGGTQQHALHMTDSSTASMLCMGVWPHVQIGWADAERIHVMYSIALVHTYTGVWLQVCHMMHADIGLLQTVTHGLCDAEQHYKQGSTNCNFISKQALRGPPI